MTSVLVCVTTGVVAAPCRRVCFPKLRFVSRSCDFFDTSHPTAGALCTTPACFDHKNVIKTTQLLHKCVISDVTQRIRWCLAVVRCLPTTPSSTVRFSQSACCTRALRVLPLGASSSFTLPRADGSAGLTSHSTSLSRRLRAELVRSFVATPLSSLYRTYIIPPALHSVLLPLRVLLNIVNASAFCDS